MQLEHIPQLIHYNLVFTSSYRASPFQNSRCTFKALGLCTPYALARTTLPFSPSLNGGLFLLLAEVPAQMAALPFGFSVLTLHLHHHYCENVPQGPTSGSCFAVPRWFTDGSLQKSPQAPFPLESLFLMVSRTVHSSGFLPPNPSLHPIDSSSSSSYS